MHFPTWLLVILVIVALIAMSVRYLLLTLLLLFLMAIGIVLGLTFFSFHLFTQHEYVPALIAGLPLMGVIVWGLVLAVRGAMAGESPPQPSPRPAWTIGRCDVEEVSRLLALDKLHMNELSHPESIIEARLDLASRVSLCRWMYSIYKGVRDMADQFARNHGEPWPSEVIPENSTTIVNRSELSAHGISNFRSNDIDDLVVLKFSASEMEYMFCGYKDRNPSTYDHYDAYYDQYLHDIVTAYVLELPSRLVLEVVVGGGYSGRIESFRPGPWLVALLTLQTRRETEATTRQAERLEEERARELRERAKKFM